MEIISGISGPKVEKTSVEHHVLIWFSLKPEKRRLAFGDCFGTHWIAMSATTASLPAE